MSNIDNANNQNLIAINAVLESENNRLKNEQNSVERLARLESDLQHLSDAFKEIKEEKKNKNSDKLAKIAIWCSIVIPIVVLIAQSLINKFLK